MDADEPTRPKVESAAIKKQIIVRSSAIFPAGIFTSRNGALYNLGKLSIINTLRRRVNLWDMDEVDQYINNSDCTEERKENVAYAYSDWCNFKGFLYAPKRARIN